ncbi:hypothetical protein DUE52_00580 [Larkinella punicea]|uniref:PIN domain-containing protein n=1 Tax=Larkinella punicea TaxID=2315727 RepID=A0A368JVS6_9BACT|nr:hypothetical protein DUE52_00580 [Larkinella punicea]
MDEIIIDTIVLDYLTRNQKALSTRSVKAIEQADTVYVCVSSLWELADHIRVMSQFEFLRFGNCLIVQGSLLAL